MKRLSLESVGVLAAAGPLTAEEVVDLVGGLMGDRWVDQNGVGADYDREIALLVGELTALDLVAGDWRIWRAGPSARTLLPRATRLAHIWSRDPAW